MNKAEREFTGRHMLLVMIAFFGVIIAVNLVMAAFASSSWTGLIVKNSYVASQDYNGDIETARRQSELGWRSSFKASAQGVRVTLSTADQERLAGLAVVAKIYRPVAEAEDRTLALTESGAGVYSADVKLGAGIWEADVRASRSESTEYRQIFRFVIKDPVK